MHPGEIGTVVDPSARHGHVRVQPDSDPWYAGLHASNDLELKPFAVGDHVEIIHGGGYWDGVHGTIVHRDEGWLSVFGTKGTPSGQGITRWRSTDLAYYHGDEPAPEYNVSEDGRVTTRDEEIRAAIEEAGGPEHAATVLIQLGILPKPKPQVRYVTLVVDAASDNFDEGDIDLIDEEGWPYFIRRLDIDDLRATLPEGSEN